MNELIKINNVRGYLDENETAQLNLEDVARGLGFTETKNGKEYIRWRTVESYINEFGFSAQVPKGDFSQQVAKDGFIPENIFYKLCFKASNETARRFQDTVTDEVLPSIRRHGVYMTPAKIEEVLLNPDTIIQLATTLKQEQEKAAALQLEVQAKEQLIEEQKPMYLLGSAVSSSETSILIGEFAKMLQQGGINIGQKTLFEWLREKGYLCKDGSRYNMPTEKSMKLKIMEYSTTVINHASGTITRYTPKITGKGQVYFINKFQAAMLPREVEQISM